jgi:hypothetical protein
MSKRQSKILIDDEDVTDAGGFIPSSSSSSSSIERTKLIPKEQSLFDITLSGLKFSQKVSFIQFENKIRFALLSDTQRRQLISEKEGWYYSCPKARHRQTPLIYPIIVSAALRFIDPQRFTQENASYLDVHVEILSRVYHKQYILGLSDNELVTVGWNESCFQALAEYSKRIVIVIVNTKDTAGAYFSFFYPDEISKTTVEETVPLVFVQGDNDFNFLYSRNRDQSINYNLSPTELMSLNDQPQTYSDNFKTRPSLKKLVSDYTIEPIRKYDLFEPINFIPYMITASDPGYQQDFESLQTTFIYDVEGGPYNNAPQVLSAALLLNSIPKYWSRTEHNFLGVRMALDKKRGVSTTLSAKGTFRMFDLADFGLASIIYNATILIRYREQGEVAFYARITPPDPSSITLMLEYRENVFFLLLPDRLNENKLTAFNTPYSPDERKSEEFLATLGHKDFGAYRNVVYYLTPAFSEAPIRASTSDRKRRLDNLARRLKGKKPYADVSSSDSEAPRKSSSLPSSPSAPSSSSSSQFPLSSSSSLRDDEEYIEKKREKKKKEYIEIEEEERVLSLNDNILVMPPVMKNSNTRRYKHATTDDTVSLIDNFKLTLFPNGKTRRQFNNNALFAWRIDFSDKTEKGWPIIYTSKPIEMIFIHRSVPVDSHAVEFPTIPPLSDNDGFFSQMLSRLFLGNNPNSHYLSTHQDYIVHARIAGMMPFGVVQDSRASPLENGVIDVDGFMQIFDLLGTLVETHSMRAHRYNLYRLYASMIQDIDRGSFSNHRMTERFLWFLYTFLLREHPHFTGENPVFTDEMLESHGNIGELFSVKLFSILFGSTCFKWQWKLSHVWLFAYICLHPDRCTIPVKYLRTTLHAYINSGVFKEGIFHNTSTVLIQDSQEVIANQSGTAISDATLKQLLSWERFTERERVRLPLYTVNYQTLFASETLDENRPELSLPDLYYHNQIHNIILQSSETPSPDVRNVDNLLFSIQTVDGLPLTSYKIPGFPVSKFRQEFLYGDKLAPVNIKKVARFIPGILEESYEGDSSLPKEQLNELKSSLLFTRIGRTVDYFNSSRLDSTITREPKRSKFFEITDKARGWFQLSDKGDYIWDVDNVSASLRNLIKQWQEDYTLWKEVIEYYPRISVSSDVLERSDEMTRTSLNIQLFAKSKKDGKTFDVLRKDLFDKTLAMLASIHFSDAAGYKLTESRRQTPLGKSVSEIKKTLSIWNVMKSKVGAVQNIMKESYGVGYAIEPLFVSNEKKSTEDQIANLTSMMNSLPGSSSNDESGYQAIIALVTSVMGITVPDIPFVPPYPVIAPSQSLKSEEFIQPPFQHLLRNTVGLSIIGLEFIKRHHTVLNTADSLQLFTRRIRTCVASLDRTLVQLMATPMGTTVWAFPVSKHEFSNPSENTVSYIRRQRDEILFSDREMEHIMESRYLPHVLMPEIYPRSEEIAMIYNKISRAKLITETPFRRSTTQVVFNEMIPAPNKITRAPTTRQENYRFLLGDDFKRFYLQENKFKWCFLSNVSVYSGINTQTDFSADPATLGLSEQVFEFLKGIIWEGKNTSVQDVYRKFMLTCNCIRVKSIGDTPFLKTSHRSTVADRHRTRVPDIRFGTSKNVLLPNLDVEYIIEYQIDNCFAMFPRLQPNEDPQDQLFFLHAPLFLEFMGIREITSTDRSVGRQPYKIGIISNLITFRVKIAEEFILAITPGFSNYHIRGYEYGRSSLLKNKQPVSILSVSNTAAIPLVQYHSTSPTASKTVVKARQTPAYTRLYAYNSRLLNYTFWKGLLSGKRYIPQVLSYLTESRYSTMYHDVRERLFENFDVIKPSPSPWRPGMPSQPTIPSSPTDITASKYDPSNISTFTFAFMVMEHFLGWPCPMAYYDDRNKSPLTLLSHVPIIYRSGPLYEKDNKKYPFLLSDFLPFKPKPSEPINAKLDDDDSDPLVDDDDAVSSGSGERDSTSSSFGEDRVATTPGDAYLAAKRIGKKYTYEVDASRARKKYLSQVINNSPTFLSELYWYLYDFPPPLAQSSKKQQSIPEIEQRIHIRRLDNYRLHFPEAVWAADDAYAHNRLVNKEASTKELRKERDGGEGEERSFRDYTFVNTSFIFQPRTFRATHQSEQTENRVLITHTPELAEEKVWRERYNQLAASKGEDSVGFIFSGIYPRTSPLGYTKEQVSKILENGTRKFDDSTRKKLENSAIQSSYDFTNEYLILQDWITDVKFLVRKINSDKPLTEVRSTKITAILTAILAKEFNDYGFLYPDLRIVCIMMSENLYTILTRLVGNVQHESILRDIQKNLWSEWISLGYTVVFLPLFQILEQPSLRKQEVDDDATEVVQDPPEENLVTDDDPTPSSSSKESSSSTPESLSDDESVGVTEEPVEDEFFSTYFTTTFLSRETSKKFLDAAIAQLLRDVIFFKTQTQSSVPRFGAFTQQKKSFFTSHVIIPRFLWHPQSDERIVDNILECFQTIFGSVTESTAPSPLTWEKVFVYADEVLTTRFIDAVVPLSRLKKATPPPFTEQSSNKARDGSLSETRLLVYLPRVENENAVAWNEQRFLKVRHFDNVLKSYNEHVSGIVKSYDSLSTALKANDRYPDDISIDYLLLLSLLKMGDPNETLKLYRDTFSLRVVLKKYTIDHLLVEHNPGSNLQDAVRQSNLRFVELMKGINEKPIVESQRELDTIFTIRSFNALAEKVDLPEEMLSRFNDPSTDVQQKRVIFRTTLFNLKLQELKAKYPPPSEEEQSRYRSREEARTRFENAYKEYVSDRSNKGSRSTLSLAFKEMLTAHGLDPSKTRTFGMTFTTRADSMHRKYLDLKKKDSSSGKDIKLYENRLRYLYETEPSTENIFDLLEDCEEFMTRHNIVSAYDFPTENNPRQNPLLENPIRKTLLRQALLQFIFEGTYPPSGEESQRKQFLNREINNKLLMIIFTKDQGGLNEFLQTLDQLMQHHLFIDLDNEESVTTSLVKRSYQSLDMNLVEFESSSLWTLSPTIFTKVFTPEELQAARQRLVNFYRSLDNLRDVDYVRETDRELVGRIWRERLKPTDVPLFQESTFKENFNLGNNYLITSINRGIAETILENRGDTHVFITSVFDIYNLSWDLTRTLDVLRRKSIISPTETVTQDREKMENEERGFEESIDAMRTSLLSALSNTVFSHFQSFFNFTCLSYSRLFTYFKTVEPLTEYMMNRKPLSTVSPLLDRLKIAHDPKVDKIGDVVRKIRAVAIANISRTYPWLKNSSSVLIEYLESKHGCSFTKFEKRIIALVWDRSSELLNLSQAYELVSAIRKHAWGLLINTYDLVDLFTARPEGEQGLSFALGFKSLGDTEMRKRLTTQLKFLLGRTLSKFENNFIRCCVLIGIPLEVIEKCVMTGRYHVLYALMDGRLNVSYKYQSIPVDERSPSRLERIIETAIEATTIPSVTAVFLPEIIDTREITIDQTGDLVQTVTEEAVPQDRPESYEHNIPITDETLNIYLEANKNFHDVLAKTKETSFKKAARSGVVTRSSKKRILEQNNVPTLSDFLKNANQIMESRNRYETLGLMPFILVTARKNLNDGDTLFKTLSFFLTDDNSTSEFSIYKEEVTMWIVNNLDTPLSDNTERTFRDVLNIPLFTGYPSELSDDTSSSDHKRLEKEYYLNYIRSPIFWNDLILLLAASHVYKTPVHIVTSLANDSNWHSTFYASVEHNDTPPFRILCLDMIYFFPLIEGDVFSSTPSSSSTELRDDPDETASIGTSRAKWCYMAHEPTVRGHQVTPAQRRKFWYECKKGEQLVGTSRADWCYMAHEHTIRGHHVTPLQRRKFWYECKK